MVAITIGATEIQARERASAAGTDYDFSIQVPGTGESVQINARILPPDLRHPERPDATVHMKGPACWRHRYPESRALCMWYPADGPENRWTVADGVDMLGTYIQQHLFQEAVCRGGDPWPGLESPGQHPRPKGCPTCGGHGD